MASAVTEATIEADGELVSRTERRHRRESYADLIGRLSVQSVRKHYDAYQDIDWDHPDNAIVGDDPRWELTPTQDALAGTAWYQAQPQAVRAGIGLCGVVSAMKMGVVFENVLKRGLLEYTFALPNRSVEFRYAYHEVIEEAQHSLMFQEFINRSGLDPGNLPPAMALGTRFVVRLGRVFPELFFFFVLGGEEPIDYAQKQTIHSGKQIHPLLKRVMQIHITEEARHLCFARNYLQERVPRLGWFKRERLRVALPLILGEMARLMLQPSGTMIRTFQIPPQVIREAYTENPEHKRRVRASLASIARLAIELDLIPPHSIWLWRRRGLGNPHRYAGARYSASS